jgi:tubulin epsilon
MPRELITIQIGQCGNQIGTKFWELALKEFGQYQKTDLYTESLSSFFRNVDTRGGQRAMDIPYDKGRGKIASLKARSIIVDMEEGVINQILKSDIGELFDERTLIKDVSGSGNNWAHGYNEYGPRYHDKILNKVQKSVEACDSLQSFLILHSLGGGTGSGVGSYIVEQLEDYYPGIFRFTASVFPSKNDDVITSPYNSLLALNKLIEHADCVIPIDNEALINIV